MEYIAIGNTNLSENESKFIKQLSADFLISKGKVPSNQELFHEIVYRAILVKEVDVPKH